MSRGSVPPVDPVAAPAAPRVELSWLAHPLPAGMKDLLPAESEAQGRLLSRIMERFELHGYQRVSLPAFEYASVLERGLGSIEPSSVLRFVEPDTGEVLAMRPDVTPQVARLVSTRLAGAPGPVRLSYRGSVLRRQHERARHDQQILQAGVELVGVGGAAADVEVLRVTTDALRAAGLREFVVDLGHGAIAPALVSDLPEAARLLLLEALAQKDVAELARRAARLGVPSARMRALTELASLEGGVEVFPRARSLLAGTAALPAVAELEAVVRSVLEAGLAPRLVVDLGETRPVPYYTGTMFQILAEGPGQAVASGGRYDALFGLFGAPRPAAGAALHVDHLRWALGPAAIPRSVRVLVDDSSPVGLPVVVEECLLALRAGGLAAAASLGTPALDYARAWRYSHVLRPLAASKPGQPRVELLAVETERVVGLGELALADAVAQLTR